MSREEALKKLQVLKNEMLELEAQLMEKEPPKEWPPAGYYTTYHVLAGIMLGIFGAGSSLLFNIVGSLLVKQHPLELIRVYLTFPLGESALSISSGATLALGCCLYLGTGAVYGIPFHLILSRFFDRAPVVRRFLIASAMGLVLWLVNYYLILSWMQPALFGGDWIVRMVPAWVAALTHLVFAWTMLVADEWGRFDREGHQGQK